MFLAKSVRPSTFVFFNKAAITKVAYRPKLMFTYRVFSADAFKPSPAIVKKLRDETGSPLKDCVKVLTETLGDIAKSKELLRKRGLADAEKRADRLST